LFQEDRPRSLPGHPPPSQHSTSILSYLSQSYSPPILFSDIFFLVRAWHASTRQQPRTPSRDLSTTRQHRASGKWPRMVQTGTASSTTHIMSDRALPHVPVALVSATLQRHGISKYNHVTQPRTLTLTRTRTLHIGIFPRPRRARCRELPYHTSPSYGTLSTQRETPSDPHSHRLLSGHPWRSVDCGLHLMGHPGYSPKALGLEDTHRG